jgi:hypothetical protein
MDQSIKDAHATAKIKLQILQDQRNKIDREIAEWKRVYDSLSAVMEDVPDDVVIDAGAEAFPLKFTDAIRVMLSVNPDATMTAPMIRDILTRQGFDFSAYKQELVPIHNTLKRLVDQGEATPVTENGSTVGYKWIDPIERVLSQDPAEIVVRRKRKQDADALTKISAAINRIREARKEGK